VDRFHHGVLASGTTKQLGMLLHWYKSGVGNERIRLKDSTLCDYADDV